MKILPAAFYQSPDVIHLARELLGKYLITEINGVQTGGKITETEAYRAPEDRGIKPRNSVVGPRVGIDYAGEDALLPWRLIMDKMD